MRVCVRRDACVIVRQIGPFVNDCHCLTAIPTMIGVCLNLVGGGEKGWRRSSRLVPPAVSRPERVVRQTRSGLDARMLSSLCDTRYLNSLHFVKLNAALHLRQATHLKHTHRIVVNAESRPNPAKASTPCHRPRLRAIGHRRWALRTIPEGLESTFAMSLV